MNGKNIYRLALAGNPNVGKSTIFNSLTGLKQHTGNWPGKTVENAQGSFAYQNNEFIIFDLPGTYSLLSSSPEEEIARDHICFGGAQAVIVVADTTCLERNLNLVLQILEITGNVVLCLNMMDEAEKKRIIPNIEKLSELLGVPVCPTCARDPGGLKKLIEAAETVCSNKKEPLKMMYCPSLEKCIEKLSAALEHVDLKGVDSRFAAVRVLENNKSFTDSLNAHLKTDIQRHKEVESVLNECLLQIDCDFFSREELSDHIAASFSYRASEIFSQCVRIQNRDYTARDRKIDRLLTSKETGIPAMLLLLSLILFITINGANYPSKLLSALFTGLEPKLFALLENIGSPFWLCDMVCSGIYKTLSWVIAVMLPPMAIFFPLFTLLEDLGYLPRVAFNLDRYFKKANTHGKQALTMCMGFGCNACGVTGCRIIDSPRERLIAVITNSFVPCNGRFPALITVIGIFFTASLTGISGGVVSAAFLTAVIVFSVFLTLSFSRVLSKTLLNGVPSAFSLELPPYRKPQIGRVIIRSLLDRTLFVLGRAAAVAAPAGLVIWLLNNINVGGISLFARCADFLDPPGSFIGLDGVILLAFLLGFPANEIVLPIIVMGYLSSGNLSEIGGITQTGALLAENGWTTVTALCFVIFSLMHFPCAATLLTIKKETGSLKWTAISFFIPLISGALLCAAVNWTAKLIAVIV